jgi:hypothetical protein
MTKAATIAGLLLAAWAADQHYNYGHFSDSLLAMMRQIRHSFIG